MKRLITILTIVSLVVSLQFFFSVNAQEKTKSGNVGFEANNIPFLNIHFVEEFFRFQWDEVPWRHRAEQSATFRRLDVKLVIVCTTEKGVKHFSLRDFWRDILKETGAKRNDVINRVTDYLYEFGFNITGIPQFIANNVEYVYWKLEGANFDVSKIELEEVEVFEQNVTVPELHLYNATRWYNITRLHLPSNLVLSYEDLWQYGYSVKHPNKTVTVVEGVKGKTDWNLDPIVYSSDIITVTGYSEGSECDFNELWEADKNGTFVLDDRDNITSSDGSDVAVDYPLRPTDEKVLGGSNIEDLYLNVTNWVNMSSTTIMVKGTNREDVSQVEYLAISNSSYHSNNGIFGTVKYYKTVTHTKVTTFGNASNNGSYDYDMTQGQWGVVWKTGTSQFMFDCKIEIGNGSTATWFADSGKQVFFSSSTFSANWATAILTYRYAYVTFGELKDTSTKATKNGIQFTWDSPVGWWGNYLINTGGSYNLHNRHLYLYSCSFKGETDGNSIAVKFSGGDHRLWNVLIISASLVPNPFPAVGCSIDIYNVIGTVGASFQLYGSATMDKLTIVGTPYLFWTQQSGTFTIENVHAKNMTNMGTFGTNWYGTATLINVDSNTWTFSWAADSTGEVYRQYEFDLTVTFENGTAIQNANVTLSYYGQAGGTVGSWLTPANGSIPQQTLSMGFYNQTGADTIYNYNPYNLTVIKDGYQTYSNNFTLSEQTDWTVALQEEGEQFWDFVTPLAISGVFVFFGVLGLTVYVKKGKQNANH